MTAIQNRPGRSEAVDYYFLYIDQVTGDDIQSVLESQSTETLAILGAISEEDSLRRYTPGKWSIREVVSHVNDCERLFAFRAFWFARGLPAPLPSFDQNVSTGSWDADALSLSTHVAEFATLRSATCTLFANLPDDAWSRHGEASGNPFTVRALAFIAAGHVAHHLRLLHELYGI
ncbi:MAG: DinB family protein [bacterium]